MSIVTVFVTTEAEGVSSERRFDKGLTIRELKYKLEPITGVPSPSQRLSLYQGETLVGSLEGDEDAFLGRFPVSDYMRIHVLNTDSHAIKNQFTDVSLVEKYEMSDEAYVKRNDSVLAFKQRNKLGRFSDAASASSEASMQSFEEAAQHIHIGNRCEVIMGDQGLKKRGTVKFVGTTSFQPGYWVGIQYDEPLGKNDGSVKGERYFTAPPNYGGFVRPDKVTVGDFPEEDIFNTDDELEEI